MCQILVKCWYKYDEFKGASAVLNTFVYIRNVLVIYAHGVPYTAHSM